MGREYRKPLGKGMRFNFSSPLGMGRVTGKYMGVGDGDGDGEGKTRPHPAPLPCLTSTNQSPFNLETNQFITHVIVLCAS